MNRLSLRSYLHRLVSFEQGSSGVYLWVSLLIQSLIIVNVLAVILESVDSIQLAIGTTVFHGVELISVSIFTLEYLIRVWTVVENPRFSHPLWGRLRYMLSPLSLVDLFAILPFYFSFFTADLRILRMLRMVRLLRMGKLARYSRAFRVLGGVFKEQRAEIITSLFIFGIFLTISASLMYFVEKDVQPEQFSSIPASFWWAIITLTTVGYGDVVPKTGLGKLIAGLDAIVGVAFFALLAGVLVTGFMEEMKKDKGS